MSTNWIKPPTFLTLQHINPVPIFPSYSVRSHVNITNVTPRPTPPYFKWSLSLNVHHQTLFLLSSVPDASHSPPSHTSSSISPARARTHTHTQTLWRSWLRMCLQLPVTSSNSNSRVLLEIGTKSATRRHGTNRLHIQNSAVRRVHENGTKPNYSVFQLLRCRLQLKSWAVIFTSLLSRGHNDEDAGLRNGHTGLRLWRKQRHKSHGSDNVHSAQYCSYTQSQSPTGL